MTGLYIFLGIIAFFVIILSVRITINAEYFEEFKLSVSWLFIKIPILPAKKSDKPKKEKVKQPEKLTQAQKRKILKDSEAVIVNNSGAFIFYKDDKEVKRVVGEATEEELLKIIEEVK